MKNALIVSLKYNPGHFSHLVANYNLFQDGGIRPTLYVHPGFRALDIDHQYDTVTAAGELSGLSSIDVAVFWFPSVRNILEVLRLRLLYKSCVIYIYHEPFDSILNYYRSGFRIKKILKICLINLVNIPVILLSNRIVLPSAKALKLYQRKYTLLNRQYSMLPLLFDDEAGALPEMDDKTCFSYIGTIAADHAFDQFVRFADHSVRLNSFPGLEFLIATRNEIPGKEMEILKPHIASGKVTVRSGHAMTNGEINVHYKKSLIVWNAYNRSMQSGVLPKAYMFGAAVITISGNENEFFDNHETGVAISDNRNLEETGNAVSEILNNRDHFIRNCRKKFLATFYYKSNIMEFMKLVPQNILPK